MTYEEWKNLPEADKLTLPESEYPTIPSEELRNFLTKAVVKKVKGVIGWETTQEYRSKRITEWFPEFRQKEVDGVTIWYAFDPTEGTYKPNLEREPSMEEEPIGSYGLAWMHFMETQYPECCKICGMRGMSEENWCGIMTPRAMRWIFRRRKMQRRSQSRSCLPPMINPRSFVPC